MSVRFAVDSTAPQSPCNRVCTLDDQQVCIGCGRHVDEIVAWSRLGSAEQRQVLERSARRRAERNSPNAS